MRSRFRANTTLVEMRGICLDQRISRGNHTRRVRFARSLTRDAVSWLDKLLAKSSKPPEIEIPTWRAASAMGDKQKRSGQESRQITSPIQAAVLNRLGDPGGLEPQPWWPSLTRYPAYDSVFHLTRLFLGSRHGRIGNGKFEKPGHRR